MASGTRTISVEFVGDAKSLDKVSSQAAKDLDKVDKAAKDVGDTFDKTATKSATVAGAFGDLGGALAQAGGPLGALGSGMELLVPTVMGLSGVMDLATVSTEAFSLATIKTGIQTALAAVKTAALAAASWVANAATTAWTAAQWLLNAALSANPIALVVIGIVALVAAIILAWKHSETFRDIVTGAFNFVWGVIQTVWHWVADNWPLLLAIITGPIGLAVLAIVRNFDTIKDAFKAVFDFIGRVVGDIVGAVASIPGRIAGVAGQMRDTGVALITALWDGIKSVAGGLADGFLGGFKTALNTTLIGPLNLVVGLINKAIDAYNKIPLVPNIPHIPEIPRLAAGGIVTRPTLALIGEAGPEAVIPLGRRGAGAAVVNITVNVPETANPAETGRAVAAVLRSYFAAGGRLQVPV